MWWLTWLVFNQQCYYLSIISSLSSPFFLFGLLLILPFFSLMTRHHNLLAAQRKILMRPGRLHRVGSGMQLFSGDCVWSIISSCLAALFLACAAQHLSAGAQSPSYGEWAHLHGVLQGCQLFFSLGLDLSFLFSLFSLSKGPKFWMTSSLGWKFSDPSGLRPLVTEV